MFYSFIEHLFVFCNPYRVKILDAHKNAQLDALLAHIQQRWGNHIIRQGRPIKMQARPVVSTGFESLDTVLGGGIPAGQTSELLGRPTSGMTTLAYKIIASAQAEHAYGIYIDLDSIFDPDYAGRCGVTLDHIFVAHPDTDMQALNIARDLLSSGSVAVISLDMGALQPDAYRLRRLTTTLAHIGCVVLVMLTLPANGRAPIRHISSPSALRLLIERQRWLQRQTDIRGYRTRVTILKHRTASGRQVEIDIDFDDNIAGEPL